MDNSTRELKPGYYVGHIQKWAMSEAKSGNPQFVLTFALAHYKAAGGKQEECPALERNIYRVITEKTIEYFVNDLKALGYDRDNFDDLDPASANAFDFSGIEMEARLKYETFEGKEREKWDLAVVKGGAEVKPLEQTGVASLNARFGSNLKSLKNGAPPVTRRPAPPPAAGYAGASDTAEGGDEIPF